MNYIELNKYHRNEMKKMTDDRYNIEWQDPHLYEMLLGNLPKVRRYRDEEVVKMEISELEKKLSSYDYFKVEKSSFIEDLKVNIEKIREKKDYWNGINVFEIEECIKKHSFCLISGEGGIGKSFFVYRLETEFEKKNIPHLCIYGKFFDDYGLIDEDEILKESESQFVLIIDAINEMTEECQENILEFLRKLKDYPRVRIIVTYRTYTITNDLKNELEILAESLVSFPGVSFESALAEMVRLSVPDLYRYENILYSNNALLLKMLCDVLDNPKITDKKVNGVASVTYILEQYIKKTVDKLINNVSKYSGKDVWENTKRIALWMYDNDTRFITKNTIDTVIDNSDFYLTVMMQIGFISKYDVDLNPKYFFSFELLSDYLIARSLFTDIENRSIEEKIAIIKKKLEMFSNLEEPIIVTIFDKYQLNYSFVKKILIDTQLIDSLSVDILTKIVFKKETLCDYQKMFKIDNASACLHSIAGYVDKPFNCTNYLFEYYSKKENILELSEALSGLSFKEHIINRLKNLLYFNAVKGLDCIRNDEAYCFSVLCCAAPNKDIRMLAEKLLYDISYKEKEFIKKLKRDYYKMPDYYIKESIVFVMSQLPYNENVKKFFGEMVENEDYISSKNIKRIAKYLNDDYGYIKYERKNLLLEEDSEISEFMKNVMFQTDMLDNTFFHFRFWGENQIDYRRNFLFNDKKEIERVNEFLNDKYKCVRNGECKGWLGFYDKVKGEINELVDVEDIKIYSFINSLEHLIEEMFDYYSMRVSTKEKISEDLMFSTYFKCIDISAGILYGSLMCNYYFNEFGTYSSQQNVLGFELYDPLEYSEEINLNSPIPIYSNQIVALNKRIIKMLEIDDDRDRVWAKNADLTRNNIMELLEPVLYQKEKWVLLAARIHLRGGKESEWKDNYNIWCCTSIDETIENDGNERYLTIELDRYKKSLIEYCKLEEKPWLCKEVESVCGHSDAFDDASLVLPPALLIKCLGLEYNEKEAVWYKNSEKVIICNNNKVEYYEDQIKSSVFIKKKYLDKYLKEHALKYFIYTERLIPEVRRYEDETSLHFEIQNGKIVKEIRNFGDIIPREPKVNKLCENCPHSNVKNDKNIKVDYKKIEDLLKKYGL